MKTNRESCPIRHENGNCICIGGFCMAVNDEICHGLRQAYERGKTDVANPREITREEWDTWKKSNSRDPLCYTWVGDGTPFWITKPEQINEVLYYMGDIKIFNMKPTKEQQLKIYLDGKDVK